MRRIETKEENERKRKRNVKILSLTMLFLMVFSTLGFAFIFNPSSNSGVNQDSGEQTQLPQDNVRKTGKINFQYGGQYISLISSYEDVENITVEIDKKPEDYSGSVLYIDAKNQGILQEIAITMGRFSSRMQEACYGVCEENLPERNCTDGNLIVWRESSEGRVYQEDMCVFIEGDMAAADAFIYKLFNS